MSQPKVGLIDYEMGNLRSVSKALQMLGSAVRIVAGKESLRPFDALVLPGVGAFDAAARNLRRRGLFEPLRAWIEEDKPFFGICLGYQLLFESSEEGGSEAGLGVLRGLVRRFRPRPRLKVPHMGWNRVRRSAARAGLFRGIAEPAYFYFVHSYYPVPAERGLVSSWTDYGATFASSVSRGNLFACQFHPEKSADNGLKLLDNFLAGLRR